MNHKKLAFQKLLREIVTLRQRNDLESQESAELYAFETSMRRILFAITVKERQQALNFFQ